MAYRSKSALGFRCGAYNTKTVARRYTYDPIFFALSLLLLGIGLFVLASASLGLSILNFRNPYYYTLHQIFYGALPGLVLLGFFAQTPYRFWKKIALPLLLIAIGLMILVFVPGIGFAHGGAQRWISLGPISFQPSEFLKFAFIIYLASWLESRVRDIRSFTMGLLPFLIMSGFIASFLIKQPDIGTLVVLMMTAFALFTISGATWRQIVAMVLLGGVLFGILAIAEPYRLSRIITFLDPARDPQGSGYQIRQALIAIGSGGLWGRGFALSRQKFSYLPEPMGDSIFAVAAEEIGFIGSTSIMLLFMLFYLRGIQIARSTTDLFGKFLATGLMLLIIVQSFVNIAAISGLGPLTGIPLPFISYGGSALVFTLTEVGIILNISKERA